MRFGAGLPIVLGAAFGSVGMWILVACLFVATCTPGWNDPHPINPEPGAPCGRVYHQCPATGGCCGMDERCGVEGHACGLHECCFTGEAIGGARTKRMQLTPEEARRIGR